MSTEIYLRETDTNGKSVIRCHLVWDLPTFIAARGREVRELNEKAAEKGKPALAKIQIVTRDDYRAEVWKK